MAKAKKVKQSDKQIAPKDAKRIGENFGYFYHEGNLFCIIEDKDKKQYGFGVKVAEQGHEKLAEAFAGVIKLIKDNKIQF